MTSCPDRDCAHLCGEYAPIVVNNVIVGSRLTNWCCGLDGNQSCGTVECPTDRKYGNLQKPHDYWWNHGQYA